MNTRSVKPILCFVALLWLIEGVNLMLGNALNQYGIVPREWTGLIGLVTAPFLHGGIFHLLGNTVPLIVLSFLVSQQGTDRWVELSIFISIVAGLLVWLFARSASHIGASILIFGYWGYLMVFGVLSRSIKDVMIGLVTVVLYGGLLFSLFHYNPRISLEGHIFGAFSGAIFGWLAAKFKD
jgi:membrane associated rhomboid family serine protease